MKLGTILLYKETDKNKSYCEKQIPNWFDFHDIKNALCGKTAYWEYRELRGNCFTPKRILVIQMK